MRLISLLNHYQHFPGFVCAATIRMVAASIRMGDAGVGRRAGVARP
jgi:hypothetical protein